MADPVVLRRAALADLAIDDHAGVEPAAVGVRMEEIPHLAKLNLRGEGEDPAFLAAAGEALGVPLPGTGAVARAGGLAVLWLGPDEWLVLADVGEEGALAARLGDALAGLHTSVVDVTDNWTEIRLAGARARDVLAKGCPIDLHPRAFGPERVAQSMIGAVDVILAETAEGPDGPVYAIMVRRSFAPFLWDWLADAGLEYGVAVGA
jgi:sarcosine oxidase subunit gamma